MKVETALAATPRMTAKAEGCVLVLVLLADCSQSVHNAFAVVAVVGSRTHTF